MIQVVHLLANVLSSARLVAGSNGTRREVSWAVTARARTPSLPPLQGGELILLPTASVGFHGGADALPAVLRSFQEAGASAVVVWGDLTEPAAAAAEELNLPLLLCETVSPAELERTLVEHIARTLRQGISAQEERPARLLEALAANRGLESILRVLSESVQKPVGYFPQRGTPVLHPSGSFELSDPEVSLLAAGASAATASSPEAGRFLWTAPVERRGVRRGTLVVLGDSATPGAADSLSLRQTAAAVAVETGRLDELEAAQQRLRAELAADLFDGRAAASLPARAAALGVEIPANGVVIALGGGRPDEPLPSGVRRLRLTPQTRLYYPVLQMDDQVLAYLPAAYAPGGPRTVPAGVSLPVGVCSGWSTRVDCLESIPDAVEEARAALVVSQCLRQGRPVTFAEAGVAGLLTPLRKMRLARSTVTSLIAPLMEYDAQHDGSLVETLRVYLDCAANTSTTAAVLHLHRNSVAYRLRRVEELTGRRLDSAEDRHMFSLALILHSML